MDSPPVGAAVTEEELVRKAKRGERDALVQLLGSVAGQVRQSLHGTIADRWQALLTADDVMQQAYTDAFLAIQQFQYDGEGSFARWLATLAKRNRVDAIRALQAAKRGGDRDRLDARGDSIASLLDAVTAQSATPSRFAARGEAKAFLHDAIGQLPDVYQHVIRRLDLDGAPVATVAEEIERSIGATYMVRARAHDRLRVILGSASRYLSDGA